VVAALGLTVGVLRDPCTEALYKCNRDTIAFDSIRAYARSLKYDTVLAPRTRAGCGSILG